MGIKRIAAASKELATYFPQSGPHPDELPDKSAMILNAKKAPLRGPFL